MNEIEKTACCALVIAKARAKVLVVRNAVDYAVRTHKALEELACERDAGLHFSLKGRRDLDHGRYAAHARTKRNDRHGVTQDQLASYRLPRTSILNCC